MEISEETNIKISIKALIGIAVVISSLIGMWYAIQNEVEQAKNLPEAEVTRMEYDLKDEFTRQKVKALEEEVEELKKQIHE